MDLVSRAIAGLLLAGCGLYGSKGEDTSSTSIASGGVTFGDAAPLATGLDAPRDIALDDHAAYLVTDGGRVLAVPFGGGAPVVLATGQQHARGAAVDGTRAYWLGAGGDGTHSYVIAVDKAAGGTPTTAYDDGGGGGAVYTALASQGETLAWARRSGSGAILRGTTDFTDSIDVADGQGTVASMALSGAYVYWCAGTSLLRKSSSSTAPPETVATRGVMLAVAADGDSAWAASDDGALVAIDGAASPPAVTVLADGFVSPSALAVDTSNVYVVSSADRAVYAVSRAGGGAKTVVARGTEPFRVAATATDLWIVDRGGGALLRVPKH